MSRWRCYVERISECELSGEALLRIVILTYSKEDLTLNSITLRIEACRDHITVLRGPISQVIRPALGVRCKGTTYLARHTKRRTDGIRRWILSLLLWVR